MQRVREIEPLIEGVERDEDRAAVFDRDMLDTREGLHDAGNLRGRKFVKSAHHPFEFEQDGDWDVRPLRQCGECTGILSRSLRVISVIDEEARQYVRVDRLH